MSESTAAETWEEAAHGKKGAPSPVHPYLFVVLECDRPWAGGARHSLNDVDEVLLGRGSDRSATRDGRRLTLRVPGKWLSTTHARLVHADGGWSIEDAGSKNGTFVNGVPVERARLRDGDVIDVGRTLFTYRAAVPTPAGTPRDVDARDADSALVSLLPSGMAKLDELRRVAAASVPVLLLGETGTGKEVLARVIHETSARAGRLVAVNCGALSATLLESLLFGHVRGAFSGAARDEPGLVRAADGGTLFLDEIGDLPKPAQAAILRVLQEREVVPVGSVHAVKVDTRFVAATHRPLAELAASGEFRQDLFARLDGFLHAVPPLRERIVDLGLLVGALLRRHLGDRATAATIAVEAGRALAAYRWPSNVRELEQCLARAVALAGEGPIDLRHLPDAVARRSAERARARALSKEDQILHDRLLEELRTHDGNISEVARSMQKARMQIQRWLKRFGIDASQFKP